MSSSTTENAIEVVKQHMAAEDRQDVEQAVECFTEDCYYEVPGIGVSLRGKHEIRRWYEDLFEAVPDFRNTSEHYWEVAERDRTTIFFEAGFEGTHRGAWMGWAPTNRSFSSSMLVRIPIATDGLMEAEIVYQDSADIFMQLGILPRLGSRQERAMQTVHGLRMRLPVIGARQR
ncbi:MAG: ester cyclase [Solirubrobacterales bacterium]